MRSLTVHGTARNGAVRASVSPSEMHIRAAGAALIVALGLSVSSPLGASAAQPARPDVLVVGGTPAGVAAAVAAARRGERVELVAGRPELGGILTDAMMDQWDLNLARDGEPIEGGIFTEIYAQLGDSFTPAHASAVFAQLVAGQPLIQLVTNAVPIGAQTTQRGDSTTVSAVRFRDRAGQVFSVAAHDVIDASDDGDVAALAGARYDLGRQDAGRDERMQPVTLIFTVTGVDWAQLQAAYDPLRDGAGGATDRRAWGYADPLRAYRTGNPDVVVDDLNLGHEDGGGVTVNAIDVLGIDGRNPADLARARALTLREAPRLVAWLRARLPGFAQAAVGRYADTVYVRETRHFAGLDWLTASDVWSGSIPGDAIGLSSYPLDLHPVTAPEKPAFAAIRHVYGIPFGSLVPRDFTNLLIASPAISASHLASGSARIIPTTIEEGEAAGAAAALAIHQGRDFASIDRDHRLVDVLQADLERGGVIVGPTTVARAHTAARA
jgi:hypothetical protein